MSLVLFTDYSGIRLILVLILVDFLSMVIITPCWGCVPGFLGVCKDSGRCSGFSGRCSGVFRVFKKVFRGVPGFSHCSGVFRGVPMFRVPVFRCSSVPVFRCSWNYYMP